MYIVHQTEQDDQDDASRCATLHGGGGGGKIIYNSIIRVYQTKRSVIRPASISTIRVNSMIFVTTDLIVS